MRLTKDGRPDLRFNENRSEPIYRSPAARSEEERLERKRAAARAIEARNPGHQARLQREHRQRHPDRKRARDLLGKALARGKMFRPTACELCRKTCAPQAHHSDYSKPYDVRWLCRECHWQTHEGIATHPNTGARKSPTATRAA